MQGQADDSRPKAWFLPSLVEVAKASGLRPTVTLHLGGLLVTGELIDGKTYFDELVVGVDETITDPSVKSRLKTVLSEFGDRYNHPPPAVPPPAEPEHIHLRGAKVMDVNGACLPVAGGASWRIQLSAVQAFTLDLLTTTARRGGQ